MNVERKPVAPIEHFRSVRSTARKLPVGFYERSVCQQRLNVATWWIADIAAGRNLRPRK
jgi:hypothetical protein